MKSNPPAPTPATKALDVIDVDIEPWTRHPLPRVKGVRKKRFQVIIKQSVLNEIHRHGREGGAVEICGVLVGNVWRDGLAPFLYIESSIRGHHASSQEGQVTFTGETWSAIHDEMDRRHPKLRIAGWYHTHPGHGIFLSGMDLFIQDNFFNLAWQVALVYDPYSDEQGVFVWRGGKSEKDVILIEPDEPPDTAPAGSQERQHQPAPQALQADIDNEARRRRRIRWAIVVSMIGMLAIVATLIAVLVRPFSTGDGNPLPPLTTQPVSGDAAPAGPSAPAAGQAAPKAAQAASTGGAHGE